MGLDFYLGQSSEIVIVGNRDDANVTKGINNLRSIFYPNKIVILKSSKEKDQLSDLLDFTKEMKSVNDKATFYVCKNFICNSPVNNLQDFISLINK